MRRLPRKRNSRQNLIIEAVKDYFGDTNPKERKSIIKIALYLMGRKKRNPLTGEEKEIMETIKINLKDKVYTLGFDQRPTLEIAPERFTPYFSPIKTE